MLGAILSGALAGGLGAAGSIGSSAMSMKMLNKQLKFQERMRATSYQVAMEDMRKAGLNPILAYQQGGAPMAMGGRMEFENPAAAALSGVSSAMGMRRTLQELKNMKAVEDRDKEAARKEQKLADLYGAEAHVAAQRQWILRMQRTMMESEIPTAKQMKSWVESEQGKRWNRWKFQRERAIGGGSPAGWIGPVLRGIGR